MKMEAKIINVNEGLVKNKLDAIIKEEGLKCDSALNYGDILALALNNLPPKYVGTDLGYLYIQLEAADPRNARDIDHAVRRAIKIVEENPRHNC